MIKLSSLAILLKLSTLLLLIGCIQTEIVPEILEAKLTIDPKSVSLAVGQTTRLETIYVDEQNIERPNAVQWKSQQPNIAEIATGGVVTAKTIGQTWIIARVNSELADSTLVTVVADKNAVAKVEITASSSELIVGTTLQLTATVKNGNEEILEKAIIWQSSDDNILTINSSGLVNAIASGTAQITAIVDGISSLPLSIRVVSASTTRSGTFRGNASYNTSGTATFEIGKVNFSANFRTSNGPGLRVYLAKNAPGVLTASNSVLLGNLKSTSGAQEYTVPAEVKLSDFDFVVVYCQPFNVAFGFARLD